MKKLLITSLVAVGLLFAMAAPVKAQTTYSTNLSAGTSIAFGFPVNISLITVSGTAAGATTVTLYDNSTTSTTYTNAAYTTAISYPTNITSIITNSTGSLQTNTYTGIFTTTSTVAANTNTFPVLGAYTAGASLVNGPNVVNFNTVRGLILSASTNATVQIQYRRLTAP